ncbi:hypothetical protein D3C72_1918070 [compost metagenome]
MPIYNRNGKEVIVRLDTSSVVFKIIGYRKGACSVPVTGTAAVIVIIIDLIIIHISPFQFIFYRFKIIIHGHESRNKATGLGW